MKAKDKDEKTVMNMKTLATGSEETPRGSLHKIIMNYLQEQEGKKLVKWYIIY